MGWFSRAKSPTEAHDRPRPTNGTTGIHAPLAGSTLLDDSLDALAGLIRILGRHAFDTAETEAVTFADRCDYWARHILTGNRTGAQGAANGNGAEPSDPPADSAERDWPDLRRFFDDHRRDEQRYVFDRLGGLKSVILEFIEGFRTITQLDDTSGQQIDHSLQALEKAAASDSLEQLRSLVPEMVGQVRQTLSEKSEQMGSQMEALGQRLRHLRSDLVEMRRRLEIDPLTQVYNRGAFDSTLEQFVNLALFTGQPAALLIVDLDHFKAVNDEFGHPFGDRVLKAAADAIVRTFPRRGDFVARYGGEEFAILLHLAETTDAARMADRLVDRFHDLEVPHNDDKVNVTCSVGYTVLRVGDTAKGLLERADAALYRAKQEGRDRARSGSCLDGFQNTE